MKMQLIDLDILTLCGGYPKQTRDFCKCLQCTHSTAHNAQKRLTQLGFLFRSGPGGLEGYTYETTKSGFELLNKYRKLLEFE